MTEEENDRVATAIETMGNNVSYPLRAENSRRTDPDETLMPAAGAAAFFLSEELRETISDLATHNVAVRFSYQELLQDNTDSKDIDGSNGSDTRGVGGGRGERVFIYDGHNNPRDSDAWDSTTAELRVDTGGIGKGIPEAPLSSSTQVLQIETVQAFMENVVEIVASNPLVKTEQRDANTLVFKTTSGEMIVEEAGDQDGRRHKRFLKAITTVIRVTLWGVSCAGALAATSGAAGVGGVVAAGIATAYCVSTIPR